MILMLARFCDLVLGFEIEAENLYVKATALLNNIRLQNIKGMTSQEEIQNKLKG